jgi:hypothetical protein
MMSQELKGCSTLTIHGTNSGVPPQNQSQFDGGLHRGNQPASSQAYDRSVVIQSQNTIPARDKPQERYDANCG